MTDGSAPFAETTEELFEEAPCGYLTTALDGTILRVNRTLETWLGRTRAELVGLARFQDLLAPGGRIYHETHYGPLLRMQGEVREIALEIVRADGTRLPALVNSKLLAGADGGGAIRTTVFDATDRRRYEAELLAAQRREHEVAHELQESLLAGALPVTPGLDIGVVYRPGAARLQVGGDWYDAFWLQDDVSVALVAGDVVGKGLTAAAEMGQLRSAVRALAVTGLGPGGLLEALDRYVVRHEVGRMATVAVARLDLVTGALTYACAGHPPPILISDGAAQVLSDGRSPPLDAHFRAAARAEGSALLPPDGTLLLYTDGLVERRTAPLDTGIRALADAALEAPPGDAQTTARGITRRLASGEAPDDVCLVVARRGR